MEQFRLPKIPMPKLELPQAIQDVLMEAEEKLAHRPKLLQLFKNCFPNTLGNNNEADGGWHNLCHYGRYSCFWLRDSVEQVMHYVPFAKDDHGSSTHS